MRREALPAWLGLARPANAAIIVVAGVSLGMFLRRFHGPVLCGPSIGEPLLFFLLPTIFSLALVWLVSEVVLAVSPWRISRPWMGRALGLLVGLGLHFSVGAIGWALFPDVPESYHPGVNAGFWIPLWIVGLLFKVGYLSLCE